jgi:hypothetical protein
MAWLGPPWLEPLPDFGEIAGAIAARKFSDASRLVERFIRLRGDAPLAQILYVFPAGGAGAREAKGLEVLAPLGRVTGEPIPVVFEDPRPTAAEAPFTARLEVEGLAPQVLGPSAAGAREIGQPESATALGPSHGAGKVSVRGGGYEATGAFEIADSELASELRVRQLVAERMVGSQGLASHYVRAMCYAREQCYCEALLHLAAILREIPNDPDLLAARAHLLARLRPYVLSGRG